MMKYILLILLASTCLAADVKIGDLPLGSAPATNINDSFPYVDSVNNVTKRLKLQDIFSLPNVPPAPLYGVVQASDLINKYISLGFVPSTPTKVVFDLNTGAPQIYGTTNNPPNHPADYRVVGNQLRWDGLRLDGDLNPLTGISLGTEYRIMVLP